MPGPNSGSQNMPFNKPRQIQATQSNVALRQDINKQVEENYLNVQAALKTGHEKAQGKENGTGPGKRSRCGLHYRVTDAQENFQC
jgi:hypothetical protein